MLDIKFVRNNPDVVKQNIKNKFQDEKLPLVDEVIELDQKNRDIKGEVEALRAEKNKISKQPTTALDFRMAALPRTAPVEKSWFSQVSFVGDRSEERRVGKECRSRWSPYH